MKVSLTATPSRKQSGPILFWGSVARAFSLAAQLGYDGVELHLRHPDEIDRGEVKNLTVEYSLGIPTLGTGMAAGEEGLTFADLNPDIRRRAVDRVKGQIDLAAHLGSAVTIGSLSGRLGGTPEQRPTRREAALACLKECCHTAALAGVTIFLEPLNRYECDYLNKLEEGLAVIRQIGMSNVKLLADTFHMNIEEVDIGASLRRAGPDLGHVHLCDSNRQAPGNGHLNFRDVLEALRDIEYQGYVSFEVLPLPNSRKAAQGAIRYVKGILSSLPVDV